MVIKIRKSYVVCLAKITFNKASYFSEVVRNSWFSKTILPKSIPKALKVTFIVDEPFDGAHELKLTSLTQNFAVFNSADIQGLYISKEVLPNPAPLKLGVKLDLEAT